MIDLNFYREHPRVPLSKNAWTLIGKTPLTLIANDEEPIVVYLADDGKSPTTFDALNNLGEVVGVLGSFLGRTIGKPNRVFPSIPHEMNVYARGAYRDASAIVLTAGTSSGE